MGRTIAIGDIHGALKALKQLIRKIDIQQTDRLVFLGDYVDGWSESAATIDYLLHLNDTHDCAFIKGNHDYWCESWLNGDPADSTWLAHGGKSTVESYRHATTHTKAVHAAFFNRMNNYLVDDQNRLFIHAGFTSLHGPDHERYPNSFFWDRTLLEMALSVDPGLKPGSKFYPKRLSRFKEIFIGHTPTTNYDVDVPLQASNLWDVDTGAAFFGRISALDTDSKLFWQSEPCYQLYPNETGRN